MIKFIFMIFVLFSSFLFSQDMKKVTLQLQWKHQFEFAGFYAAKEKGFYKDIGLDVEFLEYNGKNNIVNSVLDGKADFALSYSSIIKDFMDGKDIVFLANYLKQSPLVLVTQKDITTLDQLKNKKVMGVSDQIDSITLKLMLEKFGVTTNEIISIPATFDIKPFTQNKVDAMTAFTTNEIYQLDQLGVNYNIFNPSLYGHEYYDVNLFTSKKLALLNPKLVKMFKVASDKGWSYALNNKEEIVELILKKYNTQNKTKDALMFEAKQIEHLMFTKSENIGDINFQRVKFIAKSFIESGYADKNSLKNLEKFIFGYQNIASSKSSFSKLNLTLNEKNYLVDKKFITMCVDPDWEPYETIDKNGIHKGLVSDYIKLIEKKIDKKLQLIPTKTWKESLEFAKSGKCEILSFLNQTPKREKFLDFTPVMFSEAEVIVARDEVTYLDGLSSLKNKTIGLVKGYRTVEYIKKNYPNIKVKYIKNYAQGINMVSQGELYATINSLLGTAHLIRKLNLLDIKIAGKTELKNDYRIGVVKNNPLLLSILSKAVREIEQEDKDKILSNWISVKFEQGHNYDLLWKVALVSVLIIFILYYRQYTIKKINKELEKKMKLQLEQILEKDRMIFQQNKLAAMGEMIENIAHQWRQPLSQINGSVMKIDDTLYDMGLKDEILEKELSHIETTTKYMSDTIDDFKDFFAKKGEVELVEFKNVINDTVKILYNSLKSNSIEIHLNLIDDINIYGQKSEWIQVVLILMNNAKDILKSKQNKKRDIYISTKDEAEVSVIRVEDNGGGIDDRNIQRVFEPYFTTKHKDQGTGLGLYIAKMIVETKYKCLLDVKNTKSGACFEIIIPKEQSEK